MFSVCLYLYILSINWPLIVKTQMKTCGWSSRRICISKSFHQSCCCCCCWLSFLHPHIPTLVGISNYDKHHKSQPSQEQKERNPDVKNKTTISFTSGSPVILLLIQLSLAIEKHNYHQPVWLRDVCFDIRSSELKEPPHLHHMSPVRAQHGSLVLVGLKSWTSFTL